MHAGACRTTTGESSAACDVSGSGVEQLIDGGVTRVVSDVSVSTVRDDVTVTESADPLINSCVSVCNVVNQLSPLKYIDVSVTTDNASAVKQVTAVCDSGAEISCVNPELIHDLAPNMFGELQLRPFCGSPVIAKLTRLTVSCNSSDGSSDSTVSNSIDIWCAVVSGLHDKLLLSADVVDRLSRCDANIYV